MRSHLKHFPFHFFHIELWNLPKNFPYDVQFSHLFFIIYHLTIPPMFRIMLWKALKATQHLITPGSAQYRAVPKSNPFCIRVIIMNPLNALLLFGSGLPLFHAPWLMSWLTIPHSQNSTSTAPTSQNVIICQCFSIKCQVRTIRVIRIDECISKMGFSLF